MLKMSYYRDDIGGLCEDLTEPWIISSPSATSTVCITTVSTALPETPSGNTATGSTVLVAAATGSTCVVGIPSHTTTEVNSTACNTKVVSTCSTPILPDAELCQKFMKATCGCMKNDEKAYNDLFKLGVHLFS